MESSLFLDFCVGSCRRIRIRRSMVVSRMGDDVTKSSSFTLETYSSIVSSFNAISICCVDDRPPQSGGECTAVDDVVVVVVVVVACTRGGEDENTQSCFGETLSFDTIRATIKVAGVVVGVVVAVFRFWHLVSW
jgi:hypothetical protein